MASNMLKTSLLVAAVSSSGALLFEAEDEARPVTKVVQLLKGMKDQVEKDGEKDDDTMKDYKCWCNTNGADKQKSIAEAQEKVPRLDARVKFLDAKSKKLASEISSKKKEVADAKASIATAKALREQQNKEYREDTKSIDANTRAVGDAQKTLGVKGGFLQMSNKQAFKDKLSMLAEKATKLSSEDRFTMKSFLEDEDPSTDGIGGVLAGMKDDFESDRKQADETEAANQKTYTELLTSKNAEIGETQKMIERKQSDKADADEEKAQKKQEIKELTASLGGDVEFAEEVVKKCAVMDKEYDERVVTRNEELEAIAKAVEILDADEAHENFAKTISFMQESSVTGSNSRRALQQRAMNLEKVRNNKAMVKVREQVVAKLLAAGKKSGNSRLVALAMAAKLDGFKKVQKAIDDMVSALKSEKLDEKDKKDFCVDSTMKTDLETKDKTSSAEGVSTKMETLGHRIKEAQQDLDAISTEVAELKKQVAVASQNREKENTEFQKVVAEARQTQSLLGKAMKVLKKFYDKPSLVQISSHEKVAKAKEEPATFKSYENNQQSFGVLSMLQKIQADAKVMEAEATRAEAAAQETYTSFAKDASAAIEKKNKEYSTKAKNKAGLSQDIVESKSDFAGLQAEISKLKTTAEDLQLECGFLMKNFDLRQTAFDEEIDTLFQAKAMLKGAK
eukprot:TRINITY_DN79593_c0_g1_i1.p1 TRINITY_DN79593_c0_g1~~TRINITY_DN79593_c0_g1_i1.p1  ORF type:complete len:679 (-),score=253.16 TRINITY_DN79593_c0_g1_i1:131-2167(-)